MLENLRKLRTEAGVTQKQLADAISVSQQSINKYENHNVEPDVATLCALADYFQTSVDYLVGHTQVDHVIESVERRDFNQDEIKIIEQFRSLNAKQKSCVRLLLDTYRSAP